MASSPSSGAANATAVHRASNVNESPTAHQHNINDVDPSALITPIKADEQQLRARKKQLQLQLAIVNKTRPSDSEPLAKADTKRQDTKPPRWPPVSSAKSLPPLAGRMAGLTKGKKDVYKKKNTIEFEINQECTSIALVPSGKLAIGGFTDGTLRLFDLTGTFVKDRNDRRNSAAEESQLFDDDASFSSEEEMEMSTCKGRKGNNEEVCSRDNQRFGVVACQIHARGVHTSLLMDVAVSEDGLYAFGGVQRGSMELTAVYLGDAENYLNERFASHNPQDESNVGLLDLIRVDRHADAKLKGFGAVTRLWNGWERTRAGERPEYLMLTGKGIKNIHIWSFKPSRIENGEEQDSIWTCLYDTQTNGTSISQLYFHHSGNGLHGISKSDDQKLRVWDLSWEQKRVAEGSDGCGRPKRPNYQDVHSTESTVGVCGSYAFALSAASESIINLISLDAEDVSSPFNVTELALPMTETADHHSAIRPPRSGRQQRGELKSVVKVCGLVFDASHALLNLSDGSMVHYSHDESGHPVLVQCTSSLSKTSMDSAEDSNQMSKQMCLAKVGSDGNVVVAVSSYNESAGRGAIMLRVLSVSSADSYINKSRRFWGFNGLKKRRKQSTSTVSLIARKMPEPETIVIPSPKFDPVTTLQKTPAQRDTKVEDRKPSVSTVMPTPAASLSKVNGQSEADNMVAPSPVEEIMQRSVNVKKSSNKKDDTETPATNKSYERSVKCGGNPKLQSPEKDKMDTQLESVVHSNAATNTPAKQKESLEPALKKQKVSTSAVGCTSSPRKSSRKGMRSSPKKAAPTDLIPEPQQASKSVRAEKTINVCQIGVTVLDKRVEPELPEPCYHPKQRAKLLCEQLSQHTIAEKTITFEVPELLSTKPAILNPVLAKQDEERRNLAAKHRAEHEMVRRQVLSSIRYVISTWDIELNSNRNYKSIVESAKIWFDDALADHQVTLNDILERQVLEAESLAARQTLQLKGKAPKLQISFPFPEVFKQAKIELYSHFGF